MPEEHGKQEAMEETIGVHVSVNGINGEWLDKPLKPGEPIKLEVTGWVKKAGTELLKDPDGPSREFVTIQVRGVTVV